MNILVADDEKDIRNLLEITLKENGYNVYTAKDGIEAFNMIKSEKIDLALLDVMMPMLDGYNLIRKIREISNIPVIFLTARGAEMDKVLGLDLGADDYLVKPFMMNELLARVSAQLRRSTKYSTALEEENISEITYGNLTLDKKGCCLYKDDELIDFNAKEYGLILYLMENAGQVFTKKQLYEQVWNETSYYDENTIMVHISHLRNKIEDNPKDPKYIKTVRGIGYKFNKDVNKND